MFHGFRFALKPFFINALQHYRQTFHQIETFTITAY